MPKQVSFKNSFFDAAREKSAKELGQELIKIFVDNVHESDTSFDKAHVLNLIQCGADLSLRSKEPISIGENALTAAVWRYRYDKSLLDLIKTLLKHGADVNQPGMHDETAPFYALGNPNPVMLKFLLKKGADVNWQKDNGNTMVHNALVWGTPAALKELIKHDALLEVRNNDGETPLEFAQKYKHQFLDHNHEMINILEKTIVDKKEQLRTQKKQEICDKIDNGLAKPIRRPRFGGFKKQGGMK